MSQLRTALGTAPTLFVQPGFELSQPLIDSIASCQVLQFFQLLSIAAIGRPKSTDPDLARQHAIESGLGVLNAGSLAETRRRSIGRASLCAGREELLKRILHFPALRQQGGDVALQLTRLV